MAPPDRVADLRVRYEAGGLRYVEAKRELREVLEEVFSAARQRFRALIGATEMVDRLLVDGAERVRSRGRSVLEDVRGSVGVRHTTEV